MTEYRVVWQREGLSVKRRIYKRRLSAIRLVRVMTDPEPWKMFGKDGDEFLCCSGRECGCEGVTIAENSKAERERMPALLWYRIESREVSAWSVDAEAI